MNIKRKDLAVLLIVVLFLTLLVPPLYVLLQISLSTPQDVFAPRPPVLIRHATLAHFRDVGASGRSFWGPLGKSVVTALGVSGFCLLIGIPAAYALSKFDYRIRVVLLMLMFVTRMVPEVSIALPVSIAFIKAGLFDTTAGLILAHSIKVLPVSCYILAGVFAALPRDLERQARVDGCSRTGALTRVVLPLSLGGISVAAVFSFLLSWDEFIYASYLSLAEPTMPLKMYYYVSRGNVFYSAAYAVIIILPVLAFTGLMQRYLKPGVLAGAVKG